MQEMTLYAALDLSVGNKAVTTTKSEHILVVERAFNFLRKEYAWFLSAIQDGKGGGSIRCDISWHLGEELAKYGIDYMTDKAWVPLEEIH